ncbi:MAG: branched-chain amino acid aminotransferase [Gammaproteobacteria bacterium]|jgi:branched-chain amino acid aminotransferase
MNNNALCWINGRVVPAAEATISVMDHGLLYGDGIFEGLRFYHGQVFKLEEHLRRLSESADHIKLKLPMSLTDIQSAIELLISKFESNNGYLRLVVTRGPGTLGIDPHKCGEPVLFIVADQISVLAGNKGSSGIHMTVAKTLSVPAQSLNPEIKSLNYLNNILARIEANAVNADEALMLNYQGNVCEGSVDNVFIINNNIVITPPLSDGMLAGITRQVILDICAKNDIECQTQSLKVEDVKSADECFLTGTGAELIAVASLDEHHFSPSNPMTLCLMTLFRRAIDVECLRK